MLCLKRVYLSANFCPPTQTIFFQDKKRYVSFIRFEINLILNTFVSVSPTLTKLKVIIIDKTKINTSRRILSISNEKRLALIEFYRSVGPQLRGDYREAAELSSMLIKSGDTFTINKPVADSNARWLSKFLYSAKSYMFNQQLRFNATNLKKMQDFLHFCIFMYLPA